MRSEIRASLDLKHSFVVHLSSPALSVRTRKILHIQRSVLRILLCSPRVRQTIGCQALLLTLRSELLSDDFSSDGCKSGTAEGGTHDEKEEFGRCAKTKLLQQAMIHTLLLVRPRSRMIIAVPLVASLLRSRGPQARDGWRSFKGSASHVMDQPPRALEGRAIHLSLLPSSPSSPTQLLTFVSLVGAMTYTARSPPHPRRSRTLEIQYCSRSPTLAMERYQCSSLHPWPTFESERSHFDNLEEK